MSQKPPMQRVYVNSAGRVLTDQEGQQVRHIREVLHDLMRWVEMLGKEDDFRIAIRKLQEAEMWAIRGLMR